MTLRSAGQTHGSATETVLRTGPDRLPLSFGQEQLWFLNQLSPGETAYNIYGAYRLRGELDAGILRRSLTCLLGRHSSLRATFGSADGTPFQVVGPVTDCGLVVSELGGLAPAEREAAVAHGLDEETGRRFDLQTGPLHRFRLWRLAEEDHVLFLGFHHIVADGWSAGLLHEELSIIYRALQRGDVPDLPDPVAFTDHVVEQRNRLRGEVLAEELGYWEEKLARLPVVELPADRLRPALPTYHGDSVLMDLPAGLLPRLRTLAQDHSVSLFMVLTAALNVVLSRYTGQEDIPVGVPMLGRVEPELEHVVGLFVNMTVLRTDLSGDPTFAELLERTADASLDIYEHQEVPFEMVVERVQPVRDPSRNPLFQVSVQVLGDSNLGAGLALGDVAAEPIFTTSNSAMFDLLVNFYEAPDRLRANITFASDIYDRWRIEAMVRHIEQVLIAAVEDPAVRLSRIDMLSPDERAELLAAGRGEEVAPTPEPVHVRIARVAHADPSAVAAVCRGEEITYGELDRRAGLLARHLRSRGVGHEELVVIAMDRDLDTLVAMLGVLKSGAAFTMMDPAHPAKRLEYMLVDTATPLVITRSADAGRLPASTAREVLLLDIEWDVVEATPTAEPFAEWATGDSLAYVVYTSGSTGQPKGVLVEHRALNCFAEAYRRSFDFGPADRLLQLPALTFDMSVGEIFTSLTVGATLVLVSPEEGLAPDLLATLMREQGVTYAGLSPAILSVLDAEPYPALRAVMSGADAVPAEMVNKWNLPGRQFLDLYGPTEATVACTEYLCEHVDWVSPPPIGHPELNRLVYVVDRWGNLVPVGVPGELLIGGDEGLARGYLNQPELTAEKFVPDPFRATGRVYRSGDLVRWMPGSGLEFLGRIDHQVKLRGLRIELGEIEAATLTHPGVRMAVVLLRPDSRGEPRLVGYLTTTSGYTPTAAELRSHVGELLPEYMVPTAWVVLDDFPLTTARKIDRAALPTPDDAADDAGRPFVPAGTPTEQTVARIYAEVLSLDGVGANGNFFELGGNSLQAMRVVSRINKAFAVKINVRLLYGAATVSAISATVDGLASGGTVEASSHA
jgi:amino acid adenylation domain-containing protein